MNCINRLTIPCAWIASVATGFGYVLSYEAFSGSPSKDRPVSSRRHGGVTLYTLPSCPCTKASLEGLAALRSQIPSPSVAIRVVVGPVTPGEALDRSTNALAARAIAGAEVVLDPTGRIAREDGAQTSGQVIAYGRSGRIEFRGGLTSARGHYGESDGLDAVSAVLQGRSPSVKTAPVYGCALWSAEGGR